MRKLIHIKIAGLAVLFCLTNEQISAQVYSEILAFNQEQPIQKNATIAANTDMIYYTNVVDIVAQNYFELDGVSLIPYIIVKDANKNYNPELIQKESGYSISFTNQNVIFNHEGKTETFIVENIDQYINTSDKCLIRSKIEIDCKTIKIGQDKVSSIEVFFDQNQHISYIAIGKIELYLRP